MTAAAWIFLVLWLGTCVLLAGGLRAVAELTSALAAERARAKSWCSRAAYYAAFAAHVTGHLPPTPEELAALRKPIGEV
jgi:hypothetical protein